MFGPVLPELSKVEDMLIQTAEADYPPLSLLLKHVLHTKGKRIRPALVLLAAKFHHYDLDRLLPIAVAVELLHTATLVHDDIIDRTLIRRGSPTLNSIADASAAVLVGDYLFARAAAHGAQINNIRAMHIFARTLMTICDGELRQAFNRGNWRQTKEEYFQKIGRKTASLFAASTESGAVLSSAPEMAIEALREFGYNLGMAFQIVDDVLDFVGQEGELGKPIGSDLRQGTLTLPAIYALEQYPNDNPIAAILERRVEGEEWIQRGVEMVTNSLAIRLTIAEARRFGDRAKSCLAILPANECREALLAIANYVVERSH